MSELEQVLQVGGLFAPFRHPDITTPYPEPLQETQPTTSEPQEYPDAAFAVKETLGDQEPDNCIHPSHPPLAESAFAQPVTAPVERFMAGLQGADGQPPTSAALKETQPMLSLHA